MKLPENSLGSSHKDLIVNFNTFLTLLAVSHINKRRYVNFVYRAKSLNSHFQFENVFNPYNYRETA